MVSDEIHRNTVIFGINIQAYCQICLIALMMFFGKIPNKPDVVFLDKSQREVQISEIGCVFDLYMDIAFSGKLIKYQPILANIRQLGYEYKQLVGYDWLAHLRINLGSWQNSAPSQL